MPGDVREALLGGMGPCRTTRAKAATTRPGPHATSSTVSFGPAPLHSTISLSAASSRMPGAVAKGVAWRVN
jgi:hypothetical protein